MSPSLRRLLSSNAVAIVLHVHLCVACVRRARRASVSFIASLEKAYGCPIGWVRGDEKRFSGCGKPGAPRHYHVLMAASQKLDRYRVADTWMSMAGYRRDGAG